MENPQTKQWDKIERECGETRCFDLVDQMNQAQHDYRVLINTLLEMGVPDDDPADSGRYELGLD